MNLRPSHRLLLLAVLLSVSSCNYLPSWMGGKKSEQPKLQGERISVLPAGADLPPDATLAAAPINLPAPAMNADWPQRSLTVSSSASNLAAKGSLESSSHATAGDGEKFTSALVPPPVVAGGVVFAMDGTGQISAHDAAAIGNVRWKSNGVAEEDTPDIMGGGLAVDQDRLYATSGRGRVAAFDTASGKEIWHKSLGVPFRSAPDVKNGKLFATTIDNQIYTLNAATGEVAWTQRGVGETAGIMNSVSPVAYGDSVIVPYSSGEIYVLAAADGHELWNNSLSAAKRTQAALFPGIGGDPVVDEGVLFVVSSGGMLSAMTAAAGQHIWDIPVGSFNTPWASGDYLFILTTDNTLACLLKYDGRVRWSTHLASFEDEKRKLDPVTWRGPVLVNGNLAAVSDHGQLMLIAADSGKVATTREIESGITTAPVVANGIMYLMGQDATLYSLQ